MRSGELRHPLEVMAKNGKPTNDYGENKDGWEVEAMVWGGIRPLGVVERAEAEKMAGEATHLVTMRALSATVTPKKRIRFGARLFEVVGTMNYDERSIELRVLCKESQ